MPVRMLSVDTPEVTARTEQRAGEVDQDFKQLAEWIRDGVAPVEEPLGRFLLPKLETGRAGRLQFRQGGDASTFEKQNIEQRLRRPDGTRRSIFIRVADSRFDNNNRLLAYLAPNYSERERQRMPRHERTTFNLDLVASGWAAPFVIYPDIPGAFDLPLLIRAAVTARAAGEGIWADPDTLLPYEYRAMEKLHAVTRKIVHKQPLEPGERLSWRERYCVDMRDRTLYGPEEYFQVDPEYRLWIWPDDVNEAIGRLNLAPAASLVGVG
jgi:endonuclease YncB( thermonuclease family)